jgi:predicted MPP superfamily phosphohydrolase
MRLSPRNFQDLFVILTSFAAHLFIWWTVARSDWGRRRRWAVILLALVFAVALSGTLVATMTHYQRFTPYVPAELGRFVAGSALLWDISAVGVALVILFWRAMPPFNPRRRRFLRVAQVATLAAPVAATAFGVAVSRTRFELTETELKIRGLAPELHGLRIAHISDIHLSPFLSEQELARVVDMANEARPHAAVVTGDLITFRGDPLDECLRQLTRLRSDAGVFGCLGNHEIYAGAEDYATYHGERLGIRFLRSAAQDLRFGNASLRLVGVDYQRSYRPYLAGTEQLTRRDPKTLNVLLSHNPDVLRVAGSKGFQVMLAGHTHGGQINVEILGQDINVARFYTPFVKGLYEHEGTLGYVNRGVGTIGMPARLGSRPEVAILKLCAI